MAIERSAAAVGSHWSAIHLEGDQIAVGANAVVIQRIRTVGHSDRWAAVLEGTTHQTTNHSSTSKGAEGIPTPTVGIPGAIPTPVMAVPVAVAVAVVVVGIATAAVMMAPAVMVTTSVVMAATVMVTTSVMMAAAVMMVARQAMARGDTLQAQQAHQEQR